MPWEEDMSGWSEGFDNITSNFYHFFDIQSLSTDNKVSLNFKL